MPLLLGLNIAQISEKNTEEIFLRTTPVGSRGPWPLVPLMWPSVLLSTSAPTVLLITGLNPFTLAHCGPCTPCVRFAASVTDDDATLSTRCLARASGVRSYP